MMLVLIGCGEVCQRTFDELKTQNRNREVVCVCYNPNESCDEKQLCLSASSSVVDVFQKAQCIVVFPSTAERINMFKMVMNNIILAKLSCPIILVSSLLAMLGDVSPGNDLLNIEQQIMACGLPWIVIRGAPLIEVISSSNAFAKSERRLLTALPQECIVIATTITSMVGAIVDVVTTPSNFVGQFVTVSTLKMKGQELHEHWKTAYGATDVLSGVGCPQHEALDKRWNQLGFQSEEITSLMRLLQSGTTFGETHTQPFPFPNCSDDDVFESLRSTVALPTQILLSATQVQRLTALEQKLVAAKKELLEIEDAQMKTEDEHDQISETLPGLAMTCKKSEQALSAICVLFCEGEVMRNKRQYLKELLPKA